MMEPLFYSIMMAVIILATLFMIFSSFYDRDNSKAEDYRIILFKKICLNAKLKVRVIPGKQERYFLVFKPDENETYLLFHENPFLTGVLKYSSSISHRILKLKDDKVIHTLLDKGYGDNFMFNSIERLINWVIENFKGYENYSEETEIFTDHRIQDVVVTSIERVNVLPETQVISKMIEAEKSGDKELELKMLEIWETNYQNKKNK